MRKMISALFALMLVSCSSAASLHPPFERSFSDSNLIEQDFIISKPRLYAVQLNYGFSSPSNRQSAWAFSGGNEAGASFSAEVEITSHTTVADTVIFDKLVKAAKLTSWGAHSLHAELAAINLAAGSYTLKVKLIDAAPPSGVALSAGVVIPYRGK